MAYTLENLVQTLRRRLKDQEFDADSLTEYLNAAQNEILGECKFPFMEHLDVYDAEPKGIVDLPFDYQATIELLAKDDKKFTSKMEYLPAQDFLATDREKRYFVWTVIGREIHYILPKDTDEECRFWTLKHLYLGRPRQMRKNTDKATIPDDFIEALVLGALARAEQERDNFDYAQFYKNQQEDLVTSMKLRYGPKNQNMDNRARLAWRQYGGGAL